MDLIIPYSPDALFLLQITIPEILVKCLNSGELEKYLRSIRVGI
jgi:hypothetical protein